MPVVTREDLVRKYQWAGKVRFLSALVLFLFLLLMKFVGGYSYLNVAVLSLIIVEALLNRPFRFLLDRVDIYRFQFYQMLLDIIFLSWILYYMGGIEAPVVVLGYYVIVLWAGVVSDASAVFFAVVASVVMYSAVVISSHFGLLPRISYFDSRMPTVQMWSVLLGNVSFLFAFGYFGARSTQVVRFLERKKQEENWRSSHKFLAVGYLVAGIAHDIINHLIVIRGCAKILSEKLPPGTDKDEKFGTHQTLARIEAAGGRSADLLGNLLQFSQNPKETFSQADPHEVIHEALKLVGPMCQVSDVGVAKEFMPETSIIMADKDQLREVFVILIMDLLDSLSGKGSVLIRTAFSEKKDFVKIRISDGGMKDKPELSGAMNAPVSTSDAEGLGQGFGLSIAHGIIARHHGALDIRRSPGRSSIFVLQLPAVGPEGA
jgi:signal transduction histidine kinase